MSITFGGLASGLDTSAIISALLAAEAQPISLLESQKQVNSSKLSLIGTLEGLVDDLKDAASELKDGGGFYAYSITSSDESVASFSLTGDTAPEGAHTLEVLDLAAADRYTFDTTTPITDASANVGAGAVQFTYNGTFYDIAIEDGDGLNTVVSKINTEAGDDVTASVINVGTEGSPDYQLVIAGNDTGEDFEITGLVSTVGSLDGVTQLTDASNAQAVVDGLLVERSDNVFDDVLPGISFTAQAETFAPVSFTVEVDNEGVKENVQTFLTAYNAVMSFIDGQSQYDSESGASGDLFGDSLLSTVKSTISSAVLSVDPAVVQADTEGYSTLGLVGIDLELDGTLTMDETEFDEKLAANPDLLASLFTDSDSGLMVALEDAIEG
ncbi:MAG: flagellar filament capping protein FliD, partial [Planctomycetota bacterium]